MDHMIDAYTPIQTEQTTHVQPGLGIEHVACFVHHGPHASTNFFSSLGGSRLDSNMPKLCKAGMLKKNMPYHFCGSLNVAGCCKLQARSQPAPSFKLVTFHKFIILIEGNMAMKWIGKDLLFESVKCSWMLHNLFRRAIRKASTPHLGCMQALVEKGRVSCKGENTHAPQLLMLDEI